MVSGHPIDCRIYRSYIAVPNTIEDPYRLKSYILGSTIRGTAKNTAHFRAMPGTISTVPPIADKVST
jgi:hypothetical protein